MKIMTMKKWILTGLIALVPLVAQAADVNVDRDHDRVHAQKPDATVGSSDSRDNRVDSRDNKDKRDRDARNNKDKRDHDDRERNQKPGGQKKNTGPQGVPHQNKNGFCPPGQAKKGNC